MRLGVAFCPVFRPIGRRGLASTPILPGWFGKLPSWWEGVVGPRRTTGSEGPLDRGADLLRDYKP